MDRYNNIPLELVEYSNVKIIKPKSIMHLIVLFYKMYQSDKIILHSLNFTYFQFLILLNFRLHEKLYWVSWGADLYNWRSNIHNFKYYMKNKIAYNIRKKIKNFVGIFPPDIEFYTNEFGANSRIYHASYVGGIYASVYRNKYDNIDLEAKGKSGGGFNILIGHSSNKNLNHKEVLHDLLKYKNENIKIYIPLSYGDKKYGKEIEDEAYKLFGDRAICIKEFMDKDSYYLFLSKIDIVIFNTKRQIGLGNIHPLIHMHKKIFIPRNSVMFNYFTSQKVNICDYCEIRDMSFNKFIANINMSDSKNYLLNNVYNKNRKIEMWSEVFNAPDK